MPFFRRDRKAGPEGEPQVSTQPPGEAPGPTGDLACDHPDCQRHDGVRCTYWDRRHNGCQTQWCPDHYHLVGGHPYCRRHVAVARALMAQEEGEAVAPDLGSRAPSLCEWVATAIEDEVMSQLRELQGEESQVVTAEPLDLLLDGTPRQRYWVRSWKLSDHTGTLVKISLRVVESNDREVLVVVGRETVAALTPPWVEHRGATAAQREEFNRLIVEKIAQGRDHYLELNRQTLAGKVKADEAG